MPPQWRDWSEGSIHTHRNKDIVPEEKADMVSDEELPLKLVETKRLRLELMDERTNLPISSLSRESSNLPRDREDGMSLRR